MLVYCTYLIKLRKRDSFHSTGEILKALEQYTGIYNFETRKNWTAENLYNPIVSVTALSQDFLTVDMNFKVNVIVLLQFVISGSIAVKSGEIIRFIWTAINENHYRS